MTFLPILQAGVLRSQSPGCLLLVRVMAKSAPFVAGMASR